MFHWSLVGLVAFAFLTGEEWTKAHIVAGYAILVLIAARVFWGFVGTKHARFSDFVRGPKTVMAYLSDLLRFKAPRFIGHNPLGGLMIAALLLALTATGITGYLLSGEAHGANEWLEEVHGALAYGTLLLVALHIAGVLYASIAEGENLVRAMITGRNVYKTIGRRFGKPGQGSSPPLSPEQEIMPTIPHVEKHFTATESVRDVVIGVADGLTDLIARLSGRRTQGAT